jgi:type I restriction enzyme R subunit
MSEGLSEADSCRKFVVPKLVAAGWDNDPHSIAEQRTITDGRIVPVGRGFVRKPPKRVDYLLRYTRDFPLAVVEAKAIYKTAADAVQQAKQYAEMLGVKFAYATASPRLGSYPACQADRNIAGSPRPSAVPSWESPCRR